MSLPSCVHQKHGALYLVKANKWIRLGKTWDEARPNYLKALWKDIPPDYLNQAFWRAQRNARQRRIDFQLTMQDFRNLVHRAEAKCELTGIPFSMEKHPTSRRRPWAPSLDRVDASGIYEPKNCRVICIAVNSALSDFGDPVLMRIAKALVSSEPLDTP